MENDKLYKNSDIAEVLGLKASRTRQLLNKLVIKNKIIAVELTKIRLIKRKLRKNKNIMIG